MSTGEQARRVHPLRVVVEAAYSDAAVRFYRDVLGMPEALAFAEGGDDRVAILEAGRATLEIANPTHKRVIDEIEAGGRSSPRIRLAFQVDDSQATTDAAVEAGAELVAAPVLTPWLSLNARLDAPADLQITLFQETVSGEERSWTAGFGTDDTR